MVGVWVGGVVVLWGVGGVVVCWGGWIWGSEVGGSGW